MKPLKYLTVLSLIFLSANSPSATEPARPNVLFIAVDDLNAWVTHLGRNPQAKTPNIDRLAKMGTTFSRAYCAVPACNPARAALMTGQRPWTTACYLNGNPWKQHTTDGFGLSAQFKKAGYHVAGAGKIYHSQTYFESEWSEYMDSKLYSLNGPGVKKYEGFHEPLPHDLKDDDLGDWHVVNWCAEQLRKDHGKPLFLACGLYKPHLPFAVPRKYYEMFPRDEIQLPPHREDDLNDVPPAGVSMAKPNGDHAKFLKSGRWKDAIQSYLATCAYTDMNIGRLLDALEKSPGADNTIIVLWGDHGWSFGEKSHWRKFALWEEPTRAPLLWVAPGVTRAGTVCERPVDFMTIYPTLCELAGLATPEHVEGRSAASLLRDPASAWTGPAITTHGYKNHTVRTETHRYIQYADGSEELYDHTNDPYEWTNIASKPESLAVIEQLKEHLPANNTRPPSGRERVNALHAIIDPMQTKRGEPMNGRAIKRMVGLVMVATGLVLASSGVGNAGDGPYMATGLKIGEVTDTSAILWARLTLRPKPNPSDGPMVTIEYKKSDTKSGRRRRTVDQVVWPEGATVVDIRDAAPGATGEVRVNYRPVDESEWDVTDWYSVDAKRDFTVQVPLKGLVPATRYELRVESRAGNMPGQSLAGGFQTAPASTEPARVVFTVSTGQAFGDQDHDDGYYIYPAMLKLDPSFFVHTGDIVYYDRLAKTIDLARYHWQRTCSRPTNVAFHRQVASYFIKDDHDAWVNDCWPAMDDKGYMGDFTFEQGLAVFREQVPMGSGKTYRTYRWGKDLQVWLPEGRDYRSPNSMPDGPEKTIWGVEQKAWFKRTVQESDATFRLVISPTPIVGPDRDSKADNHSNKTFTHEGDEIRQFIAAQQNMAVICGDRHWQYMSVHPTTGVREYSCGPASDKHAGGWKQSDYRADYHQFLAVQGGFLSVTIERVDGKPTATFRYHDVHGNVRHEDRLTLE